MTASIGSRTPISYGSLSKLDAEPPFAFGPRPRSQIALSLRIPKGLFLHPGRAAQDDFEDPFSEAEALVVRYGGDTLRVLELTQTLMARITPLSEDAVELLQTTLDLVWSEHSSDEAQSLARALNARFEQLPISIDRLGAVHVLRDS